MSSSFAVHRANSLGPYLLERLLLLTNHRARGDLCDDGSDAGSTLHHLLRSRLLGAPFPRGCWAIIAHDGPRIVGWSMLTQYVRAIGVPSTGGIQFYIDPLRRRSGLARALLQQATVLSQRRGIRRLIGRPWNTCSEKFFSRMGFTPAGHANIIVEKEV